MAKYKKARRGPKRSRPIDYYVVSVGFDHECPVCRMLDHLEAADRRHPSVSTIDEALRGNVAAPEMGEPRTGQSEALNVRPEAAGSEHAERT